MSTAWPLFLFLSELEAPPVSAAAALVALMPFLAFFYCIHLFALTASVFSGVASPSIPIAPASRTSPGFAF